MSRSRAFRSTAPTAAVALLLLGCSAATHHALRAPATSSRFAPAPGATASITSTPATTSGSPLATGFDPLSFTAISDDQYWVLGSAPCGAARCAAIERTSDGGASFTQIAAPPLPVPGSTGTGPSGPSTPTLRFTDRSDGFAFVTGRPGTPLYVTHNGGGSWTADSHPVLPSQTDSAQGQIVAFASGAGEIYVVSAHCSTDGCAGYRLWRSPVMRDAWSDSALPFAPGNVTDLETHGQSVWLMGSPSSLTDQAHDELARSVDGGRSFTTGPGPCSPDLGGALDPTSASDVWAVCPTGLMAQALRSVNGGVSFTPVNAPVMRNSAVIGAASATTAVLGTGARGVALSRTTDGGSTWAPAKVPPGDAFCAWIGFTDTEVGAALVDTGAAVGDNVTAFELWRTTDAGATWNPVRFR